MLKILQARLQQYVNWELPDVQARFRKGRGTRGQIANIHWSIEKVKEFQKNIYFCFIDYAKAFDCIQFSSVQSLSHVYSLHRSQQLWKVLKEIGISDYFTCLLQNLYAGQEATVRAGPGTMDWFWIGKGMWSLYIVCQPAYLVCQPFLFSFYVEFSSVQSLSRIRLFAIPWIAARQASLSITNSQSSPKLMCIKSVMPSSHLILCHPLLLLPSVPPSIRVFSNESALHMRWPKYWSFSISISPSNEHPGLVSFRMDWLGLLAVQGTHKSLLQHHSSKA